MADIELSHEQIVAQAEQLRTDLHKAASEQIGMGNYRRLMAEYQRILNNLIVLVREDAEADAKKESTT